MKKRIMLLTLFLTLVAATCFAVEGFVQSSGLLSSSGVVGTNAEWFLPVPTPVPTMTFYSSIASSAN